jgi:hypothetical protein
MAAMAPIASLASTPSGPLSGCSPLGSTHALLIFARFSDESGPIGTGCSPDPWAATDVLPPVAQQLTSGGPGSLQDYFALMSLGQHDFTCEAYPEVVNLGTMGSIVPSGGDSYAAAANKTVIGIVDDDLTFDLGDLRFDADADGAMDFVFVFYRQGFCPSGPGELMSGGIHGESSLLGPDGGTAFTLTVGQSSTLDLPSANGATLAPIASQRSLGSYRVIAVHEYLHDFFGDASFFDPEYDFLKKVPGGFIHLESIGPYGTMDGTGRAFNGGGGSMAAIERAALDWLDPGIVIDPTGQSWSPGDETTVLLRDVVTEGPDGFAIVKTHVPTQYFILECRDSTASVYTDGGDGCTVRPGYSGLVIQHISTPQRVTFSGQPTPPCPIVNEFPMVGWWAGFTDTSGDIDLLPPCLPTCPCNDFYSCPNWYYPPAVDLEVATGDFEYGTWAPDPWGWDAMSWFENSPYGSAPEHVFGSGANRSNMFTPYTNPNTNLYWADETGDDYHHWSNCDVRWDQSEYSGLSFYDIHWVTPPGTPGAELSVTIRWDGLTPPAGPHPLPDGMEWSQTVLLSESVEVEAGNTLEIEPGTRIVVPARDTAVDRLEVLVNGDVTSKGTSGSPVRFGSSRDATYQHFTFETTQGSPIYDDPGFGENGAPASDSDWFGIHLGPSATADFQNSNGTVLKHAAAGVAFDGGSLPDLALLQDRVDASQSAVDATFIQDVSVASDYTIPQDFRLGLQSDLEVADSGTLTVEPGVEIQAASSPTSATNYGKENALVEMVVRGTFLAIGTEVDPILLGSDGTGSWGGIMTDIVGAYEATYGFYASVPPVSHLEHVAIEDAARGIRIADVIAPGIVDVTFSNIVQDRHIVIDSTDVVLPEVRKENANDTGSPDYMGLVFDTYTDEAVWELQGGTRVFATAVCLGNYLGVKDKADLAVQGKLLAMGDESEMLLFALLPGDTGTWGSIFFDTPARGSRIAHAEIANAEIGVNLFYADDVTVECSLIHSFTDAGVYAYGSSGDGPVIQNNAIVAGGLLGGTGVDGIRLERADQCTVNANYIDFRAVTGSQTRSGVRILNTKIHCLNLLPEPRIQSIAGNHIQGPGLTAEVTGLNAIRADWACGGTNRTATLSGNYVDGWPAEAVRLSQSLDVDVACNRITANEIGVDYLRSGIASSPPVRLRGNSVEALSAATTAIRATEASTLDLGPAATDTGSNEIAEKVDSWLILENDPDDLDLDARNNYWYRNDVLQGSETSIEERIATDIASDTPDVLLTGFYTTSPTGTCYPADAASLNAGCAGGSRVAHSHPMPSLANRGDADVGAADVRAIRFATELGRPVPNPFGSSTRIAFTVGTDSLGRYRIDVFDVGGRRVRSLLDGFPGVGQHEVTWSGRDVSGARVAPGVYFIRMAGPGYDEKRKLVLLR